QQISPCRREDRVDTETEERQRGLGKDRGGDRKGRVDDDLTGAVRDEVAEHDSEVRRARGARGLDEFLLLQRQDDSATDAGRGPCRSYRTSGRAGGGERPAEHRSRGSGCWGRTW